ncbi:AlbA family DNA-binding domain-containing protein [Polymorphospora rubra]|uniref:AlbA family DNA-binding domain-containing protein n=1 Tax=Polymorphospora rubra TaxID=338584 RepID=UPI001BB442EA|nr:ATP-binding protein [Polymorphospora rubra]
MTTPRPAWDPTSYAEAVADIDHGKVAEHHYLELKAEYRRGQNEEMRKDIAALANDSGVLVVGVEEDKETRKAVKATPIQLAGFIERVENATLALDPPLHVECHALPDPDDQTRGVVFIRVPASSLAPHQATNRYYGRDECSVYRLSDAEVEVLIRRRTERVNHITASLSNPELFEGLAPTGRLAVVAHPTTNHNDELLAGFQAPTDYYRWLDEQAEKATAAVDRLAGAAPALDRFVDRSWNPTIQWASTHERRPAGVARVTRPRNHGEGRQSHFVVYESGVVIFVVDDLVKPEWGIQPSRQAFDWRTMWTATMWTACMARQVCRSAGLTDTGVGIGIRVEDFAGSIPETAYIEQDSFKRMRVRDDVVAWNGGTYQRVTQVSAAEAKKDLAGMVRTLFGQLMRSTGLGRFVP